MGGGRNIYSINIDCDYIISKFEIRNPRRMELINI